MIDNWLDRIATECRVEFSAMTVRRSVFEELGGFCTEIGSAFDWEMWQRIAVHHRVWFDPRPLVVICRDGTAETDRLAWDGSQVLDGSPRANALARTFPPTAQTGSTDARVSGSRCTVSSWQQFRSGPADTSRPNATSPLRSRPVTRRASWQLFGACFDEDQPLLAD